MSGTRAQLWSALSLALLLLSVALAALAGARLFSREWLTLSGAELRALGVDAQTVERARAALEGVAGISMLDFNPDELRRRLESMPGVAEAIVRRRPRGVEAELRPRVPLARWADGGLVSARGARYAGKSALPLPVFSGAAERTPEMAEFYDSARTILAARNLSPAQLDLSERGDWRVVLSDGAAVYLGRERPRERLRRFARHYHALLRRFARVETADMRYERGFAVRGQALPAEDADADAGADSDSDAISLLRKEQEQ